MPDLPLSSDSDREDVALAKFRRLVVELFTLGMDGDLLEQEVAQMWADFLGPDEEDDDE